jgi:predicted PurR-regulated permease PerM
MFWISVYLVSVVACLIMYYQEWKLGYSYPLHRAFSVTFISLLPFINSVIVFAAAAIYICSSDFWHKDISYKG